MLRIHMVGKGMKGRTGIRWMALAGMLMVAGSALSQSSQLTLEEALKLAVERNGDIRAALEDNKAADGRVQQSYADFLPTLTPSANYRSNRTEVSRNRFAQSEGWTTNVEAAWTVLDSGQRNFNYTASRRNAEATKARTQQTVRTILFNVYDNYLSSLRASELLRVSKIQEERTQLILEQTKARVEVRDDAAINILQAQADYENARVNSLEAQNNIVVADAQLKAIIGWDRNEELPSLVGFQEPSAFGQAGNLEELVAIGLKQRPDLVSARKSIEALRAQEQLSERNAFGSLSLTASFDYQLTPDNLENRAVGLFLSYPLFDGGSRRAAVKVARAQTDGARAGFTQSEREARQEIEAEYKNYELNVRRVNAAKVALEAARRNYQASVDAQKEGALTIIQVSTAQVSLVTAESNYINAIFDYYRSEARLKLVTGQQIPGEQFPLNNSPKSE